MESKSFTPAETNLANSQGLITEVPLHIMNQQALAPLAPRYEYQSPAVTVDSGYPHYLELDDIKQTTDEFRRELETSPEASSRNTHELFTWFPPVVGVQIDERKFYISEQFAAHNGRLHAIGYTRLGDGTIAPRLFYKSQSEGSWRVSPVWLVETDEEGKQQSYYSKGETMYYGYARETRLDDDLETALEAAEDGSPKVLEPEQLTTVRQHFIPERLGKADTYNVEASEQRVNGLDDFLTFRPGSGFKTVDGRPAREVLAAMSADPTRLPDFKASPIKVSLRQHSILGSVKVETYRSRDKLLDWNMAYTADGKVWLNGLTIPNDTVNSYGTNGDVLVGGILDSKPLEYDFQVEGLEEGVDYRKTDQPPYVELLILDQLEPIRNFRAARHIVRQAA